MTISERTTLVLAEIRAGLEIAAKACSRRRKLKSKGKL